MSAARDLPARPSLDSLRKQARRLARVHAQLPRAKLPLSNRDAQLVVAREYGFVGWSALTAEVQQRVGGGLEWAASQAQVAIHNEDHERLRKLLAEYPALVSWRDESDQMLLDSTTSYAMDCSDPERERTYTRPVAAEMLIDAGATVERRTWEHVIKTGASGMLHLLARKKTLPQTPPVLAALGEDAGESSSDQSGISHALMIACRWKHTDIALRLLERAIELDPELGSRIDRWQRSEGRKAFVEFLAQQPGLLWHEFGTPWETFVIFQLAR